MNSEEKIVGFDATAEFAIEIRDGANVFAPVVRYPTDKEWADRSAKRKIIIKPLGRGQSETKVPETIEIDAHLYEAIRLGESPDLDEYVASKLIEILATANITDIEMNGSDEVTVTMSVVGGVTVHALRIPTLREIAGFRKVAYKIRDLPLGHKEFRIIPGAGADLYDKCAKGRASGYAPNTPIPAIHRDTAMRAVIDLIESASEPVPEENF